VDPVGFDPGRFCIRGIPRVAPIGPGDCRFALDHREASVNILVVNHSILASGAKKIMLSLGYHLQDLGHRVTIYTTLMVWDGFPEAFKSLVEKQESVSGWREIDIGVSELRT